MDFHVGQFAKDRMQPLAKEGLRVAIEQAPRAQAFTGRVLERSTPARSWLGRMRRRLATGGVLVLAVWLLAHALVGENGIAVYRQKRSEYEKLQADTERLQKENEAYQDRIKALKSDLKAIEKEAREVLHYVRRGEMVYIVPAPANPNRPATNTAQK